MRGPKGLRLDWYAAEYPSVFKPYFDSQLLVLSEMGVRVRIHAFGQGPGPWPDRVRRDLLPATAYVPDTLPRLVKRVGPVARTVLRHPIRAVSRVARGWAVPGRARRRAGNALRATGLPAGAPDAILVHNLATLARLNFLRALYPRSRFGFYYHGGEPAGVPPVPPVIAREALQLPDVLFTNTRFSAGDLEARGAPPERVRVVPLGFLAEDFPWDGHARRPAAGERLEVISVGRLSEEKGHAVAIEAVSQVVAGGQRVRFHLVGNGPELPRLRDHAAALGIADSIVFHGALTAMELQTVLRIAHCGVLPSIRLGDWEENQACVVQELLLHGLPVLASRTGGVPECITPDLVPRMHEPGDAAGLAAGITSLLALPSETWQQLATRGRAYVESRFDARALTADLLEGLVGGP